MNHYLHTFLTNLADLPAVLADALEAWTANLQLEGDRIWSDGYVQGVEDCRSVRPSPPPSIPHIPK